MFFFYIILTQRFIETTGMPANTLSSYIKCFHSSKSMKYMEIIQKDFSNHIGAGTFLSLVTLWSPKQPTPAKFWTATNLVWFKRQYSLGKLSLLCS